MTDDREVLVPTNIYGTGDEHYHTDRECHLLQQADEIREVPLSTLFDDIEECPNCAGENWRTGGSKDIYRAALNAGGAE